MSQALYRRYRSQRFSELVGQQSVTRVLRNAITRDRLNHAYLFCGPRGTGKTSVARIFSKAINCLNPREGDCCGECEVCLAVAEGRAADVIEIDAASYRKVEETKEILIDRVGYAPLQYKRKVYIIDEVHMLSTYSFNAILKTLEEPPEHVIFCLCTTEPHQLPLTILSRCIRFDFHRLPLGELAAHLQSIATQEGFSLASDAAHELAMLAEGSARDSISLLDQLLVFCDTEIALADVRELFQLSDPQLLRDAADRIASGDPAPLLAIWQDLAQQGADAGQFLVRMAAELKRRYVESNAEPWRRALGKLWEGLNLLKYENFPALLVELTLLSAQSAYRTEPVAISSAPPLPSNAAQTPVAATQPTQAFHADNATVRPTAPATRPQPISYKPPTTTTKATTPSAASTPATPSRAAEPARTPLSSPTNPPAVAAASGEWQAVCEELKQHNLTTYALVKEGVIIRREGDLLRLVFDQDSRPAYRYIQSTKHAEPLCAILAAVYGAKITAVAEIAAEPASRAPLCREGGDASTAGSAAQQNISAGELPVEISADVFIDGYEDAGHSAVDSTSGTVDSNETKTRQATKQDVMLLFEAEEVVEDN